MNILPGHKITLRALLFFAAVTLIVYFLPRTDKNHYIYEVNRPWSYALLTAPFDIPVHLDSASVAVLKDSIDWGQLGFYLDKLYTHPARGLSKAVVLLI